MFSNFQRLDSFVVNKLNRQMAAGSVVSRSGKQEPGDVALDTQVVQRVALPLHVQTLQRALKLDRLFSQVESVFQGALDQHNHQQPKYAVIAD